MTDENTPSDRFRDGTAFGDDDAEHEAVEDRSDQHVPEEDERLLARVPEWVVPLGAGSLFTATLITLAVTVFLWYSVANSRWYDFQPYEIVLASLQLTLVTVFQAVGVYFARKRIRWMWVMLAAIGGSLTIIALPFTAVALVCIGLGKYHFTLDTPVNLIRSDDEEGSADDGDSGEEGSGDGGDSDDQSE